MHYWAAIIGAGISYLHGQVCFGDHNVEKTITFGENHGPGIVDGTADLSRTKYAVIAGQNFPGTRDMIPHYNLANKAKEKGCKFVVIDPKLGDTTPWCDEWIPIKPGSDTAFALGIANMLIKEKLYDVSFLLKYTNASQLIIDDGRALKDGEGHYLVWDTQRNFAKLFLRQVKLMV